MCVCVCLCVFVCVVCLCVTGKEDPCIDIVGWLYDEYTLSSRVDEARVFAVPAW